MLAFMKIDLVYIDNLLRSIPATFWGVVIGSVFTLVGVIATNWHAGLRLKIQLAHERELKGKERELSVRKEIYLSATEAIAEGMNSIMRFPDLEISPEKLTQRFNEKAAAMAKVHVIAREKTVQRFVAFTTEFNAVVLRLSTKRFPFIEMEMEIAKLKEQNDLIKTERDKTLEVLRQMNIEGIQNSRRFAALDLSFEQDQIRIKQNEEKAVVMRDEIREKRLEYMRECMNELHALRTLLLFVLAEVREELEVPIDLQMYSNIMNNGHAREASHMKNFIEQNASK